MTSVGKSPFEETAKAGITEIRHIIAIASGKGGVGKSTVATNLAVALQKGGAKVGLMDADIYGPSQPGMLGSENKRPEVADGFLHPINRYGIDFISMGLLVGDETPVIWRAPMAMKMIQQFIGAVVWGRLDYLLIDLPPGTGDVQLTLAQQASLTGAIIVTTPQQVALGVARKGLRMFEQVKVPIVGIIENMSGFTCGHCGKITAVFKEGGGEQMAKALQVPFLGALPLDPEIMLSGDDGTPVLNNSSDSPAAKAFTRVAENVRKHVEKIREVLSELEPQEIAVNQEGDLTILWPDKHRSRFSPYHLRTNCACASCVDEDSGRSLLDPKKILLDISITSVHPVGRYGLAIAFSDGHNTGIYTFEHLTEICECPECTANKKQDTFSV